MQVVSFGDAITGDEVIEAAANSFNFGKFGHLLSGLTFFGAVLHVLPIARPFLAPFEGAFTAQAGLRWEAVLGLCLHGFDISGLMRFYEFPKPRLQGSHFELTSVEKFH